MTLVSTATHTASSLLAFWNDSRLRVADARLPTRSVTAALLRNGTAIPWREALRDILNVGCGLQRRCLFHSGVWRRATRRATPSAGALYPFEVIAAITTSSPEQGTYLYNLEDGRLVSYKSEALSPARLGAMGVVAAPGEAVEAVFILVSRPWLSMKKYRLRGYTYCHLDAGHVAANLALYATALGCAPSIHLRFSRTALARHLGLEGLCREPIALLAFSSSGDKFTRDSSNARIARSRRGEKSLDLEHPDAEEVENWEYLCSRAVMNAKLQPPVAPLPTRPLLQSKMKSLTGVKVILPTPRFQLIDPELLKSAILHRRSAKGFRSEAIKLRHLSELLASMRRVNVRSDAPISGSMGVRVRLVARNNEGAHGVYAYDHQDHALQRIGDPAADYDFRPSCMRQEMVADAAALILFHAPIRDLFDHVGYSAFAELHFYAAQLAHMLYLTAVKVEVGVTAIGGFDETECARLGELPDDEEVIYVIAVGLPDERGIKHDRLDTAYSHGHRR